MNANETNLLISRYFDATATAAEERRLREILADPATEPTEAVEEARAVMGLTIALGRRNRGAGAVSAPRRRGVSTAAAAAVAALLIGIGWSIAGSDPADSVPDQATIYAGGKVIHSTDQALALMHSQLGAMGRVSAANRADDILKALE